MSDHDTDPTSPENDPPEPSPRQLMDRIEATFALAVETRAEVAATRAEVAATRAELESIASDVRLARHALAVAADDVLERRQDVLRVEERLDRLQAKGCSLGRTLHGRGNGHG